MSWRLLDRGEFDSIVAFLRDEATNAREIGEDVKKVFTGEGPESAAAELGDAAAASEAWANAVIYEHPVLFNLLTRVSGAGRSLGMD